MTSLLTTTLPKLLRARPSTTSRQSQCLPSKGYKAGDSSPSQHFFDHIYNVIPRFS